MAFKKRIHFYVDGRSEKAIKDKMNLTTVVPSFVQRTMNGKDVKIEAIAKECSILLNSCQNLSQAHIFIIDKEKRSQFTALKMEQEISSIIKRTQNAPFDLIVADIMFENWILSDIENVSSKHSTCLKKIENSRDNEGLNGAAKLDELWIDQKARYSSDKITNSKKLFKSVRLDTGIQYSDSLSRFINILTKHGVSYF